MHINKVINVRNLNFFILLLISLFLIQGCGKKDGTSTGDNKTGNDKDESFSPDKPFHVVFSMSGTTNGTVDAYYSGKKCRTQSSIDAAGQKMSAGGYFNEGDTVYMVSEFAGTKTGLKFSKMEFAQKKDQMDITSFKDKIKNMDKIGSEEILGRNCDIYRAKDSSYSFSLYKETIPLKFSSGKGKIVMVATKLETDAKIPDDMFVPPADVKYTDETGMMKDMKDPKNMENMKEKMKQMEDVMKNYKK